MKNPAFGGIFHLSRLLTLLKILLRELPQVVLPVLLLLPEALCCRYPCRCRLLLILINTNRQRLLYLIGSVWQGVSKPYVGKLWVKKRAVNLRTFYKEQGEDLVSYTLNTSLFVFRPLSSIWERYSIYFRG